MEVIKVPSQDVVDKYLHCSHMGLLATRATPIPIPIPTPIPLLTDGPTLAVLMRTSV